MTNTPLKAVKLQRDIRNAFFANKPTQSVSELALSLEKMVFSNKQWARFFNVKSRS
jgi:hypothetical protein